MLKLHSLNFKTIILVILIFFTISCSDSKPEKLIQSYSHDLNSSIIPADMSLQINVFANYSDGTSNNVTDELIWSSSDDSMASVIQGLVTTNSATGSVAISYKTQDRLSSTEAIYENTLNLEIQQLTLQKITLSKSTLNISIGSSQSIQAIGTFDNNQTYDITNDCNWSSQEPTIAIVGDIIGEKGVIKGIAEGDTTIEVIENSSNISSNLEVIVTEIYYTDLSIDTEKTEFNVEQTLQLQAIATTDNGEQIILNNSDLTWQSSDDTIISIDDSSAIATALEKGEATISATITQYSDIQDTAIFGVVEDSYMRLFNEDGDELEFSEPKKHKFSQDSNSTLAEFSIKAVGESFTISELAVTDFDGISIRGTYVNFVDLNEGDLIQTENGNITFTLSHDSNHDELRYSFKIDDKLGSSFVQNYELED